MNSVPPIAVAYWIGAGYPYAYLNPATANGMMSRTVLVNDVVIGIDKIEHFFQQGYWYTEAAKQWWGFNPIYPETFNGALLRPSPYGQAYYQHMKQRLDGFGSWMEGGPHINSLSWPDKFQTLARSFYPGFKKGMFGDISTGVISAADINANYDGFLFYQQLARAYEWTRRVLRHFKV